MGKNAKKAYLEAIRWRYHQAKRLEKTKILDEFCAVCHYHRKYALRKLAAAPLKTSKSKPGKPSRYNRPDIMKALKVIWLASGQMASKRLQVAIPLWLPQYEKTYGVIADDVRYLLLAMSAATMDRLLEGVRVTVGKRGLSGTKPGTLLKKQIPIQAGVWDVTQPGFMEADTVAHCGDSLAGDFAWSLTMTDICTGWTEYRVTWNKGSNGVLLRIKEIEKALPFQLQGFDCDNGSEFLNWHLLRYFQGQKQPVQFTRSRPYHSNDNAHVEQKNWSGVRQLLGYDRFDNPKLINLINDLYAKEFSLMNNYFCPTMKLASKKRIGSKIVKHYGKPQTPAQRLMEHPSTTPEIKAKLQATLETHNPFVLRATIERKLRLIFKFVR